MGLRTTHASAQHHRGDVLPSLFGRASISKEQCSVVCIFGACIVHMTRLLEDAGWRLVLTGRPSGGRSDHRGNCVCRHRCILGFLMTQRHQQDSAGGMQTWSSFFFLFSCVWRAQRSGRRAGQGQSVRRAGRSSRCGTFRGLLEPARLCICNIFDFQVARLRFPPHTRASVLFFLFCFPCNSWCACGDMTTAETAPDLY